MNTLQFYKDTVAVKYGYHNWAEFVEHEALRGFFNPVANEHFLDAENEAAELYAEEAYKEQLLQIIKHVDDANTAHWSINKNNPDKASKKVSAVYVSALTNVVIYLKSRLSTPLAVNTDKDGK